MLTALGGPLFASRLLRVLAVLDPASHEVDPVNLQWSAPPECPTAEAVRAAVHTGSSPHPVRADATVTEVEGRWSVTLHIRGYGGEDTRTLDGESCEALADATALLIQIATGPEPKKRDISESRTLPTPEPPQPSPAPPERPVAAPDTAANDTSIEPRPRSGPPPVRVHTRVAGFVQLGGLLPALAAAGVGLAAGVSIPWARLEARGSYVAPRRLNDPEHAGIGIDVDGWGVGGSGCGVWEGRTLHVPLCLGGQAGRTRARALGLEDPGIGRGLWAQFTADTALGVRVHPRVVLTAGVEALVSLRRPSFRVRGHPTLFQTGPAASRVFGGIEVRLWSSR